MMKYKWMLALLALANALTLSHVDFSHLQTLDVLLIVSMVILIAALVYVQFKKE